MAWQGLVKNIIFKSFVETKNAAFDIRLTGGENVTLGLVEVKVNGTWGTVCDSSWGDEEAQVRLV